MMAGNTFLTEVRGFTPVIDALAAEVGFMTAAVYGVAWRFCQMDDGVCRATQERMARMLGLDRTTVLRHLKVLCEAGYLRDLTPDLRNRPHRYADTGKSKIVGLVEARVSNEDVAPLQVGDDALQEPDADTPRGSGSRIAQQDGQNVPNKMGGFEPSDTSQCAERTPRCAQSTVLCTEHSQCAETDMKREPKIEGARENEKREGGDPGGADAAGVPGRLCRPGTSTVKLQHLYSLWESISGGCTDSEEAAIRRQVMKHGEHRVSEALRTVALRGHGDWPTVLRVIKEPWRIMEEATC